MQASARKAAEFWLEVLRDADDFLAKSGLPAEMKELWQNNLPPPIGISGHSQGAATAARLMVDYPEIQAAVLLAPSFIPAFEPQGQLCGKSFVWVAGSLYIPAFRLCLHNHASTLEFATRN